MPHTGLLKDYRDQIYQVSRDEMERNNAKIITTLKNYKIEVIDDEDDPFMKEEEKIMQKMYMIVFHMQQEHHITQVEKHY